MEKIKNAKKDPVGPDGLTKKERRALKVQARQPQDILFPLSHNMPPVLESDCTTVTTKAPSEHIELQLKTKKISSIPEVDEKDKPKMDNKERTDNLRTAPIKIEKCKPKSPKQTKKSDLVSKQNEQTDNKLKAETEQLSEKELRKMEWKKKLAEQPKEAGKENLSKAELKAKRREQQEAQRLAKTLADAKNVPTTPKAAAPLPKEKKSIPKISPLIRDIKKSSHSHKVQLVQHLYVEDSLKHDSTIGIIHHDIHPSFVRLGVQYSSKTILGSNARCLALLAALKHLVDDLQTPPKQEFCRYLETVLQTCTNYLHKCRPLAVSMTNAIRHFKLQLTQIDTNLKDNEKRARLQDVIDVYINDDIKKAGDAISLRVKEKISNGDIILTYGCSSLIKKILLEAHKDGKKFEVIVTDGRPLLEGKEMLRRLVVAGIKCQYIFINAVSYVMSSVNKVVLGAHALLTNGYVMSRIGTAQVALVAQAYNKPVLVCCETYKFSERVQTDSFVYNEIDDPDKLSISHIADGINPLKNWKVVNKLTPLNLLYDITPPDFVTAVVTEIAILPCTSVPVVLRINATES